MTDPIKPRRKVTGLISTTSSLPSPIAASASAPALDTTPTPRIRAKVDPGSLASSSTRPPLRSTPSSVGLGSHTPVSRARSPGPSTSSTTPLNRARSPLPPHARVTPTSRPSPTLTSRITPGNKDVSTNTTPVARVRAAKTVVGTSGNITPGQRKVEDTAELAVRARARARALSLKSVHVERGLSSPVPAVSLPITPQPIKAHSHLLSPPLGTESHPSTPLSPSWHPQASPEMIDDYPIAGPSSNRSSPTRQTLIIPTNAYAQHALAHIIQHPTASAPSSPVQSSQPFQYDPPRSASRDTLRTRPRLPYNPHSNNPPPLPPPPISPELKSIALPSVTPAHSSEESSRAGSLRKMSGSGSESSVGLVDVQSGDRYDRDRLSGVTAVNETAQEREKEGDLDVVLGEDEEEAKVNRKVADLEISNASLMAINRTLEATKAKQRAEIIKLRRMLRESIGGADIRSLLPVSNSNPPLTSPLGLFSPDLDANGHDEHSTANGYMDEEMADEQLDARWDKVAELVGAMRRRGEQAVERGKEEVRAGPQRVLGWHEVDENESTGAGVGDQSVEVDTPPNMND